MPRALLITYEFPPMGGVGVQRCLKFAKYLPRSGWDVTVLTVDDPPSALLDETLLSELPPEAHVRRVWSLEPTRLVQWLKRRRSASDGERDSSAGTGAARTGISGMPSWVIKLVQAFFIPDEKRLWRGPARRAAMRIVAAEDCSAVISSGPPFTAHLIGRDVAQRSGIPLLVDFRDPWVGNYFFNPPTPLHAWLRARWERKVVTAASSVVVVSRGMADDLAARYPEIPRDRFRVIANGFDPEDIPSCVEQEERFTIAYLGNFQASVSPGVFLSALRCAMDSRLVPDGAVGFRVVGPANTAVDEAARRCALGAAVETTGFLPHRQALAEVARAHVMLLVLGGGAASGPILTGKLLEYLGLRRPVLALVPPGAARALVEEAHAGTAVDPDDVAGVAAAIGELYHAWLTGTLPVPDEGVVARYERPAQARELAALLDSVTSGETHGSR